MRQMDTWESRMALKAKQRRIVAEAESITRRAHDHAERVANAECVTCLDGLNCHCVIHNLKQPCACIGFLNCIDCGRTGPGSLFTFRGG